MGGGASVVGQENLAVAGKRIILFERRTFTFTNLTASQSQTIPLERAVDVTGYQEGTLQAVVHAIGMSAGQTVAFTATPVQLVDAEPQTDFLAATAAATVSITSTITAPRLVPGQLTSGFGSHVQIGVTGTQGAAGGTTLTIAVTLILVLKD
jgi:hypothetical protein